MGMTSATPTKVAVRLGAIMSRAANKHDSCSQRRISTIRNLLKAAAIKVMPMMQPVKVMMKLSHVKPLAKGFTWESFIITFTGCIMGITLMAAALSKFLMVEMRRWEQLSCLFAALLMIAPSLTATLVGVALVIPMMVNQFRRSKLT